MATYLPTRFPLFWEELRRRMRGGRMQVVLLIYTLLLTALLFIVTQMRDISSDPREWPAFGKGLWNIFLVAQMGIIIIISPGLTVGAISSEKEQGTLDLLLLTRMGSLSIVLGKYFGAIGQVLFLLLAGLPIISVVFFFGGVSPWDIALGYTLTLTAGLGYSALGFFTSCRCKRVVPAVAWGYALMLLLAVLLPLVFALICGGLGREVQCIILATNPLASYIALMSNGDGVIDRSDKILLLITTILTMVSITVLVLAESTMMVRRLRGLSTRFMPRLLKKPVSRQANVISSQP